MPERQWTMRSGDVQWDSIAAEVAAKVAIVRAAWQATERECPPEFVEAAVRDLYGPIMENLGRFCAAVEFELENGSTHDL